MLVVDSVTGSEVVDTLNVVFVVFSGASTTVADVASVEFVGGVGVDGSNGSKMRGVDTAGAVAVCIGSFVSVVGDCGASPCASVESCTNGVVDLLVFVGVGVGGGVDGVGMELMNLVIAEEAVAAAVDWVDNSLCVAATGADAAVVAVVGVIASAISNDVAFIDI